VLLLCVPFAVAQLSGFVGVSALTNAFNGLPAGIWYFIDLARLDFGIPLVLSAFIARFLIRRLPVIG
jgi:hypothetical protein